MQMAALTAEASPTRGASPVPVLTSAAMVAPAVGVAAASPGSVGRRAKSSGQNATARLGDDGAGSDSSGASQWPRTYTCVALPPLLPGLAPAIRPVGTARKEPAPPPPPLTPSIAAAS